MTLNYSKKLVANYGQPSDNFFRAAKAIALSDYDTKAAVGAQTLADISANAGGELVSSFLHSIRYRSVLDSIAHYAQPIPVGLHKVMIAADAAASTVDEGAPKPVTRLTLNEADAPTIKAAALLVASKELLESTDGAAQRLFESQLEAAVITASNDAALSALNVDSIPSTGGAYSDLQAGLAAADDSHSYVIAAAPAIVRELMLHFTRDTPRGSITGGAPLEGLRIIAVDGWPLTIIPAGLMSMRDHGMTIREAHHASLQMADDPGDGAQQMVNLFQTNSIAIRAERHFQIYSPVDVIQVEDGSS